MLNKKLKTYLFFNILSVALYDISLVFLGVTLKKSYMTYFIGIILCVLIFTAIPEIKRRQLHLDRSDIPKVALNKVGWVISILLDAFLVLLFLHYNMADYGTVLGSFMLIVFYSQPAISYCCYLRQFQKKNRNR